MLGSFGWFRLPSNVDSRTLSKKSVRVFMSDSAKSLLEKFPNTFIAYLPRPRGLRRLLDIAQACDELATALDLKGAPFQREIDTLTHVLGVYKKEPYDKLG
jgi:hypothetical protein